MEAVTELGLRSQIVSSIKTQEWASLGIYFGFSSVGGEKEERGWPLCNINQTRASSFRPFPPRRGTAFPR